jgi:hypothetical protein
MGNTVRSVIIMGAGGRDFHNFNIVYCNRIFASQNGELAPLSGRSSNFSARADLGSRRAPRSPGLWFEGSQPSAESSLITAHGGPQLERWPHHRPAST